MNDQLIVFSMDGQRYALPVTDVERIVRTVEITPLPGGPEKVTGIINYQGQVIPVINIRMRFGLPDREAGLDDRLVIAHTGGQIIAFEVDYTIGVLDVPENEVVRTGEVLPQTGYVKGIVKQDDGMIPLLDISTMFSFHEKKIMEAALEEEEGKK